MFRIQTAYRCFCIVFALSYLAFRAEIFEEEYEQNHPVFPSTIAFNFLSLNWETFDKDNAPKAFVFDASTDIQVIGSLPQQFHTFVPFLEAFQLVRDKSPPGSAQTL